MYSLQNISPLISPLSCACVLLLIFFSIFLLPPEEKDVQHPVVNGVALRFPRNNGSFFFFLPASSSPFGCDHQCRFPGFPLLPFAAAAAAAAFSLLLPP